MVGEPDFFSFGFGWVDLTGPVALDRADRAFWMDLWRAPVLDAVEDQRIETRHYGPVIALAAEGFANEPRLNLVLGAGEPRAVADGHLEEALDWLESVVADFRVPISMGGEEAGAAEELLNQRGYRRDECLTRYLRLAGGADLPEPPGIEVIELDAFNEGFGSLIGDGFELDPVGQCFLDCLPGRQMWRCYLALNEKGYPIGAAAMRVDNGVASLGFAATAESERGRGAHLALLRRRILDAAGSHRHAVVAEVEESFEEAPGSSPAARNLLRHGFGQAAVRPVWRPPA